MGAINEVGVYKFVRKPWNAKDLIAMVHRALEHSELIREGRVLMEMLEMAHRQQHVELTMITTEG
jgi:DNA-binding NtrC family response regulator